MCIRDRNNGGNILMMQVENEYGSYGEDKAYLRAIRQLMEECGVTCPLFTSCLLYTSPSPRDRTRSRMPSSA
ncbi:beta-galactosidase [Streptococcus pneumoniae D39]|nr:beta-galactosidase [Streptococcus pneumoniae D39]